MHPRTRIILVILIFNFLAANCSSKKVVATQEPTWIDWESLQIAPKAKDNSCREITPKELETAGNETKQDFTSGLAFGFFPKDLSQPHKIAYDTYWVDSNEQLVLNWIFWYPKGNAGPLDLRLFILLDEHQLTTAFPQLGGYNDLYLSRGDDLTLEVTIPPLTAGVHDVVAIAVPYFQNDPDQYGITDLIYSRMTLIAEPAPSPFRNIDFVLLPAEGSIKDNDPWLTLELTLKNNGIDVWNWPDPWLHIQTNTAIPFYALTGHQDVTNVDAPPMDPLDESFFAILLFVDYQQIEVAPDQMAFYGRTDKDTAYGRIPLEVPPLSEGKHHILVLRIDTPGVPFCLLHGGPKGRILPNFIYGKLVGIEVLPSR